MKTLEELLPYNTQFDHNHGFGEKDVEIINNAIYRISLSRNNSKPSPGDTIRCVGPKKTYENGFLQQNVGEWSSICTQPYIPFVDSVLYQMSFEKDRAYFSASGGYWIGTDLTESDFKYLGKTERMFRIWGSSGATGNGAIHFKTEVNKWKIYQESIY
jgi:hypothetical protein